MEEEMEGIIIAGDDEQIIQEEEIPYIDVQLNARESMKASVAAKKQRAARFRKALFKKSSMLKIKLWQNAITKQEDEDEEEEPVRHVPSTPPPAGPCLSPDITSSASYRYTTPKKISTSHSQMNTSSSSASDSDESEREMDEAHESDTSSSAKSIQEGSLILSNQGDPIVRLDASVVEDFLRSGKPIRAAALAALEAVHGKKFTDSEALQQLRKVYTMKPSVPKGRGRRTIAKRAAGKPIRGPQAMNWCRSCDSLVHRNCYFQVGDIVRLLTGVKSYFLQIQTLFKDWREGAYASMVWLTPKKGQKGHLKPFNPRNFDIRRDIPCLDCALDEVAHVMHMPTDYFDGHPSYWQPRPGMVYMRLGEPLVEFRPLEQPVQPSSSQNELNPEKISNSEPKDPPIEESTEEITDTDQVIINDMQTSSPSSPLNAPEMNDGNGSSSPFTVIEVEETVS